ncbi:CD209 antigen-like protein E [Oncorhynchus nerka]|uniref:CD209 antigen-like protein E n=1 Tax=Oncorhynchus nerka TaxID=8023 RepID=UPI001130B25F|nr:CD209 antigen-like protein E [Oncorhynchus nerka]
MTVFPGWRGEWAGLLTCQTIFLVLIGLLVSISTNQGATEPLSNSTQPWETPEEELASLRLKLSSELRRYSRLCDDYASLAQNCSATVVNFTECPEWWLHVPVNDHHNHVFVLQEALEKEASRIGGFNNYFWIDLSDREIEGDWRWVDHTKLTNEYVLKPVELAPDNNLSGGIEGEGPVVLESNTQTWSDVPFDFTYRRICQMNVIPITCPGISG